MRALLLVCLAVVVGCHQDTSKPVSEDELVPEEGLVPVDERVLTCEGAEPAPPPPTPGGCREQWCWVNPLPQGQQLTAVWASGPDTAWMVGYSGTVVHASGDVLELSETGTQVDLYAVWGSSEQDVWAAGGGGALLHWDGAHWQLVPGATTEKLTSLTGSSATDVWAAGEHGTLQHWDGVAWTQVGFPPAVLTPPIASAGPGQVWTSTGGNLLRCSPSGCETVSAKVLSPESVEYHGVTRLLSFSPDEVFALTSHLLRWKDGVWSDLGTSDLLKNYFRKGAYMTGSGPEDIWVHAVAQDLFIPPSWGQTVQQLLHFGTTSRGPLPPRTIISGESESPIVVDIAAASPRHLYLVSNYSEAYRLAEDQWRELVVLPAFRIAGGFDTPGKLYLNEYVSDVVRLPGGEVGVADAGTLKPSGLTWHPARLFQDEAGNTWTARAWRESENLNLGVARVSSEGTVTSMYSSKEVFDGNTAPNLQAGPIVGIHGSSASNVWVVSASKVLQWDGKQWIPIMALESTDQSEFTGAVYSTGPYRAWIGLTHGLLAWNGRRLGLIDLPDVRVNGLWASSLNDVWAVGARGTEPVAYHFDGKSWSEVKLPAEAAGTGGLVDVVGRCEGDVYLVGKVGAVLHWDGAQWKVVPMTLGMSMKSARKIGSELWVVGGSFNNIVRHPW